MQLSKLKQLSDSQLHDRWHDAKFPFDFFCETNDFKMCLTTHASDAFGSDCTNPAHREIQKQIDRLGLTSETLREHLEEMYALRLFYAKLYKNPVPASVLKEKRRKKARVLEPA